MRFLLWFTTTLNWCIPSQWVVIADEYWLLSVTAIMTFCTAAFSFFIWTNTVIIKCAKKKRQYWATELEMQWHKLRHVPSTITIYVPKYICCTLFPQEGKESMRFCTFCNFWNSEPLILRGICEHGNYRRGCFKSWETCCPSFHALYVSVGQMEHKCGQQMCYQQDTICMRVDYIPCG